MDVGEPLKAEECVEESVKTEKPAKTSVTIGKTIQSEDQLPADDHNKDVNLADCDIKLEPDDPNEIEVCETPVSADRAMKRNSDTGENPEIKKFKEEQSDSVRRRSLRNETAATIKKKPPKYEEIFNCYKRKEYKECIIYLELVSGSAKDCVEYSILKAACFIHLGIKITEAHKILDDVLKLRPDNVFTMYAKGLACYHEQKWRESIKYFEKSLDLDKSSSMQRAEVMLRMAREQLEKQEELDQEKASIAADEEEEDELEEQENPEEMEFVESSDDEESCQLDGGETKDARNIRNRRFGCELCGKYFGKKFNLDRHNRTIHNRDTPYIAPLPRNHGRKSSPLEDDVPIKSEAEDENEVNISEEAIDESFDESIDNDHIDLPVSKKKQKFKIRLGGNRVAKAISLPSLAPPKNGLARCKVCKKTYRKGSLARHEIIHTGNKPHKCDQCSMAFYQKSDLQRHLTIHSDNFDYECELCDKKFRIKKNLQVHNKRHHSNVV